MDFERNCAVVIPCLNEASRIGALIPSIRRFLPAVYVVDDGSEDGTGPAAQAAGAVVLRHAVRRGKGAALLTGCNAARAAGFRYAITMDGDGQHAPEDIPQFLGCLARGQAELIVGNRMDNCAGMPLARRLVNWWMSRRISKLCRQKIPDTQCGFRLMDIDAFLAAGIRSTRFEMESEVLLAFAAAGRRIESVPIRVIYADEQSKINPLQDTWRWFRWFRRARKGTKPAGQGNAGPTAALGL